MEDESIGNRGPQRTIALEKNKDLKGIVREGVD
jgi:hypothetical protein